ncbi:exonuclease RecJ [Granulicella rosea]|uniref:Single-stranded-DNA-specific exonuclease RecJ n=1 Tax=Granulicella rosea TaxID=474952 RepID=A0A239GYJ8_9BACT|nr:single-stranded-DNA-specific exonuclease RecJ [Granulicella rosea]SNS74286.1 exonuclease RecJ [Granulicella rosea]
MTKEATKRWVVCEAPDSAVRELAQAVGCPESIARLLVSRGVDTPAKASTFFSPALADLHDPLLMLGMASAVERIERAVRDGEPILIYGDYDVDGTTATVLLKTAIERIAAPELPAQVTYHVPHRLREGYGIQNSRLGLAAESGVRLVISVDTGIRAFAAAEEAKALGLDLIVTDHHLPDGMAGVPEAVAVINPAQEGCPYPYKQLCGAAVAFKLAHALLASAAARSAQPEQQTDRLNRLLLPSFLKLVAIATVADSVSLTGENRAIVWLGLRELKNPVQSGLRALMEVAKLPLDRAPTATEVGFRLAPRINAAGRMDIASDVVELFLTRDVELAKSLAQKLDDLNQDRRATEAAALEAIELQLLGMRDADGSYPPHPIVLDHPEWHRGVLGILASRVVERTGRPALILTEEDGQSHGSGRSIPGFHLLDALTAIHDEGEDDIFTRFGGHAHAVGFSLPKLRLAALRERLEAYGAKLLTGEILTPEVACDLAISLPEITPELFDWLDRCAPFGMDNPEPVFVARGLRLSAPPRIIKDRHICLQLTDAQGAKPINAMGWSRTGAAAWSERTAALTTGSNIDTLFRLRRNLHPQYGGLELELIDIDPA